MSSILSTKPSSTDAKDKYTKNYINTTPTTQPAPKNQSAQMPGPASTVGFIMSILSQIFFILLLVLSGSFMLYYCRVAQSNILPTCSNKVPYTYTQVKLEELETNGKVNTDALIDMNIVKNTAFGNLSTKLYFSFENNTMQDRVPFRPLFDMIYGRFANQFTRYIATTIQGCLFLNLTILNTALNFINSICSETVIIFIMPMVMSFGGAPLLIFNCVYLAIMFLYNILLFKDRALRGDELRSHNPGITFPNKVETDWISQPLFSIWGLVITWLSFITYLIYFFIFFGWAVTILIGAAVAIYSVVLPLTVKANLVEKIGDQYIKTEKYYSVINTFLDVLKYKLNIIMYIISFMVVTGATSAYSVYTGFCVIIGCILLYHFSTIYERYVPLTQDKAGNWSTTLPTVSETELLAKQVTKHCTTIIDAISIQSSNAVQIAEKVPVPGEQSGELISQKKNK